MGRASRLLCVLIGGLFVYLLLKRMALPVAVFLLSLAIGWTVQGLCERLERRLRLPRKPTAVVLTLSLWVALGIGVWWVGRRAWSEAVSLAVWLTENAQAVELRVSEALGGFDRFREWLSGLPFIELTPPSESGGTGTVGPALASLSSEAVRYLGDRVASLLRSAPGLLIALAVSVAASVYWSMDARSVLSFLWRRLPCGISHRLCGLRSRVGNALRRILRAYLLLFLLTLIEVFLGLKLLGQPYAFALAILTALVDVLPVLGAGTVLVPWALVMLLLKNYSVGLGLLILYGVITLVRQVAEPRLVGDSLGVHPLVTLFFSFFGLRLFGVIGLLLAPLAAVLAKELFLAGDARGRGGREDAGDARDARDACHFSFKKEK